MVDYLRNNFKGDISVRDITAKFNERFGLNKSVSAIWCVMSKRGILKKQTKDEVANQKFHTHEILRFKESDLGIGRIYEIYCMDSDFIRSKTKFVYAGKYKLFGVCPNYLLFESLASGCKECFANNTKFVRLKG